MEPSEEILNILFKPWEYMVYPSRKTVTRSQYGRSHIHTYDTQFETLKSYNRSFWKLADVVKFGRGYTLRKADGWQSWFLGEKDFDTYLKRHRRYDRRIQAYARNQYAILLGRYKWIKYKGYNTYRDYGSFIMMLTGSKIGYIRKYYTTCPYQLVGQYPYTKDRYKLNHGKLFHGVKKVKDVKVFLENLVRKLSNEN